MPIHSPGGGSREQMGVINMGCDEFEISEATQALVEGMGFCDGEDSGSDETVGSFYSSDEDSGDEDEG